MRIAYQPMTFDDYWALTEEERMEIAINALQQALVNQVPATPEDVAQAHRAAGFGDPAAPYSDRD